MTIIISSEDRRGARLLNPIRITGWSLIAALVLTPAIAIRFTHQVGWMTFDLLYAGGLLIGAALAFELVIWRVRGLQARLAIGLGILGVALFVWSQGAVGIFQAHSALDLKRVRTVWTNGGNQC